jgi:hypothetical protein
MYAFVFGGAGAMFVGVNLVTYFPSLASPASFDWLSWLVVLPYLAGMIPLYIYLKRYRCPRCGNLFFWPDKMFVITKCVHCGFTIPELRELAKRESSVA